MRINRLALSLLLLLSACQPEDPSGLHLTRPRQGTFMRQVSLVGDTEARRQAYLAPAFSAKLQKMAEDGATVKKGEVVALLDIKDEEEDLEDQQMDLDAARNALQEHDRTTAGEQVRLEAEIERALTDQRQKALLLRELEAGTRPEELRKKSLQVELATRARDLAEHQLSLREKLAARGMGTALEVLQARLALSNASRDLRVAEAEASIARTGATRLTREIARMELTMAGESLKWARLNRELSLKKLGLERQKKQARLESVQLKVRRLQTRIRQATLYAPMAGTVILNRSWTPQGLKRVEIGDEVFEGNPFMSVADLSDVRIRAELDETLLREVKPGMACALALPSLPGKTFAAHVTAIGVLAHERSKRRNVQGLNKVFDLEILPERQEGLLKPGTSVDIQLPLQERRSVLLLPREAIYRANGGHYVLLADGTRRSVSLGEANPEEVVIRAGLSARDQVRLPLSEKTQPSPAGGHP